MRRAFPIRAERLVLGLVLLAVLSATGLGLGGCLPVPDERMPKAWRQDESREYADWRTYDMSDLMEGETWFTAEGSKHQGVIRGYGAGPAWFDAEGGYFELAVISRRQGVPVKQSVRVYFDKDTRVIAEGSTSNTVLNGIAKGEGYNVTKGAEVLEVPFYVNGGRMYATEVRVPADQRVVVP